MEFSAEQIKKARDDIHLRGILYPYRNEVDTQCQLNAAVELLRRIVPEQAVLKELEWHAAMQEARDFLSAFPEGKVE